MPPRKLVRPYLAVQMQAFVSNARADIDRLCSAHLSHTTALMRKAAEQERQISALMHDNTDLREELNRLREDCHNVVQFLRERADQEVTSIRRQLENALLGIVRRDPAQRALINVRHWPNVRSWGNPDMPGWRE